jgi:NNP family nitrate/nitrite transporter-like MFS transporter
MNEEAPGKGLQLAAATLSFACCFAVFGSVSAMMPILREQLGLSSVQVSIAVAVPVLLGSLGRLPLGMATDRYGGRKVFILTMIASIIPAGLLGFIQEYWQLLLCGFFAGISLASFAVGVSFVSRWYPPEKQGTALGVYGAGNIGQSLAAYGSPLVAGAFGYRWGFWTFAILLTLWLMVFMVIAKDAGPPKASRPLAEVLQPLKQSESWALSLFYFLTFGGFVAMSIYLPIFLTQMFSLTPQDAGLRTAGFVVLATVVRPLGGMLSDRIGGRKVLGWVFPIAFVFGLFLACPLISTFTVGALGLAATIGIGNGAVFKLVPEFFPTAVGTVTGLVGASGGLGGFFPPLLVGALYEMTDSYSPGFILLSTTAVLCWIVLRRMPERGQGETPVKDLALVGDLS